MSISKAQQKATAKYVKANYDRFEVKAPKGTKDRWKGAAQTAGESLNSYIVGAVEDRISKGSQE